MSVVLDASVTLSWLFDDEPVATTDPIIDRVNDQGAFVPSVWRLEVTNGLNVAVRRGRIDNAYRSRAIYDLSGLPIEIDLETDGRVWTDTLALSDRFGLTIYDATYLELAVRRGIALASLDRALCRAGEALGIETLGL